MVSIDDWLPAQLDSVPTEWAPSSTDRSAGAPSDAAVSPSASPESESMESVSSTSERSTSVRSKSVPSKSARSKSVPSKSSTSTSAQAVPAPAVSTQAGQTDPARSDGVAPVVDHSARFRARGSKAATGSSVATGAAADAEAERIGAVTWLPGAQAASQPAGPTEAELEELAAADAAEEAARVETRLANDERAELMREKNAAKQAKRAENVSMHALTRRDMSRWELEKILIARELDPEEVELEIARLEGVGLIDDAALAETFVRTQHERKGLGRSSLVSELRRRHIDQEHIDAALEQLDGDAELNRAKELAERRAPQLRSLDQATANRRLTGFLMRKGYPSHIVRAAVDEALAGSGGGVRFR